MQLEIRSVKKLLPVILLCLASAIGFGQQISTLKVTPNPIIGATTAEGTVTLSKAAGSGGLKINLTSSVETVATVPGSVTVAAGSKTATFSVTSLVVLAAGHTTITGEDPASKKASEAITVEPVALRLSRLTISPASVSSGKTATGTVTLTENAAAGGFQVELTSAQTFVTVPASLAVKAGAKIATFTIGTDGVTAIDTATIRAKDSNGYSETATFKVDPPALRVTKLTLSAPSVTASNPVTGTVTLSEKAPAAGFVVNLSSTQTFVSVPTSLTVKPGALTGAFTITTKPVTTASAVTITAKDANGETASATLTVNAPPVRLSSMSVTPASVVGGTTATGKVTLTANAAAGGFVVNLSTMQTVAQLPLTVTVPAGSSSATFTVNTTSVTATSSATIDGADANGYTASTTLSVTAQTQSNGTAVSMTNSFTFSPQTVTVAAGSTVTWTNMASAMGHTVNADVVIAGLASGNVAAGKTFSWTVPANATSGTAYYYHCAYHGFAGNGKTLGQGMAGVIFVK